MDLPEQLNSNIQDFFEQSRINNLILPLQDEAHKYFHEQQIFKFQNDCNHRQVLPQDDLQNRVRDREEVDEIEQLRGDYQLDIIDSSLSNRIHYINNLLEQAQEEEMISPLEILSKPSQAIKNQQKETYYENEQAIETRDLESIITFLVAFPNNQISHINQGINNQFPQFSKSSIVQVLMQKFSKLKKTKQELIKYCMRKAFKFILQLPKNQHIIQAGDKKQKYSFSKCKNKYLKRVSEQKSMNNKFLQQIFSQCDFRRDYIIFLQHFEDIMIDDNDKKIKYLADLLTNQKEGKARNVEMVKRLPWTKTILDKVLKISKELLKFSEEEHL